MSYRNYSRRRVLASLGGLAGVASAARLGVLSSSALWATGIRSEEDGLFRKTIPGSGETIASVGMGTWITFNVGPRQRDDRCQVLKTFFELGGQMVDSSPMYGQSESVLGHCLERFAESLDNNLFSATKVWTSGDGEEQVRDSYDLWGLERFDLLQVHNLLNWREHLAYLRELKSRGKVRYIGITTSHERRHDEMERIMREEPLDFVQLTYNIVDREAEQRLLPLARERGIAVIANRPYRQKELFHRYQHRSLPEWAGEVGCTNWAEFFLKFIISHPAVTCAIPATTQVEHMRENMGAMRGMMPNESQRQRMADYIQSV